MFARICRILLRGLCERAEIIAQLVLEQTTIEDILDTIFKCLLKGYTRKPLQRNLNEKF